MLFLLPCQAKKPLVHWGQRSVTMGMQVDRMTSICDVCLLIDTQDSESDV